MKYFALLFWGIFIFYRLTSHYIDQVGMSRVLATEIKTDYAEADYSKAELKRAMRYHGVLSIREDEKGEWYFIREGRQCKVFGELCLQHTNDGEHPPQSPVADLRHQLGPSKNKKLAATALDNALHDKMS